MARNRVIYQSEGLYVNNVASSGSAASSEQLARVQSANYSFTINRQDVNQYGDLARIDSLVLDPPTVNLDFSYYLTDGFNERALGFFVQHTGLAPNSQRFASPTSNSEGNFASGQLTAGSGVNFYIVTSPAGDDLNQGTPAPLDGNDTVIGLGNAYLTDYSVEMSVGSLPTVSVSAEASNVNSTTTAVGFENPAVDQEAGTKFVNAVTLPNPNVSGGLGGGGAAAITALRPGDITLSLSALQSDSLVKIDGADGAHIQSASISIPLSRSPIDKLGSRFPFAREVDFPVSCTFSVSAVVSDTQAKNLADILDYGESEASLTIKDQQATPQAAVKYTLKGLKIDSQSFSSSIGSNKSVDLTFSTQIGGPNDTANGVFMSGVGFNPVFV
tara:strand:- start:2833 stop:3990 length:1158 start_codon:yes stop_codon:yes gene_type:complete